MEVITFIIGFGLGIVFVLIFLSISQDDIKRDEKTKYTFVESTMCTKCGRRPKRWDNLCNSCEDAKWGF